MASRIANAAKGIRFASSATAANPWLAERVAIKEHAGRTSFPFLNNNPLFLLCTFIFFISPPDSRHNNNGQEQFRNRTYLRNRIYTSLIRIDNEQRNSELSPLPHNLSIGIAGRSNSWSEPSYTLRSRIGPPDRFFRIFGQTSENITRSSCTCILYPSMVNWTLSPSLSLSQSPFLSTTHILSIPCVCINARALSLGTLSTTNKRRSDSR